MISPKHNLFYRMNSGEFYRELRLVGFMNSKLTRCKDVTYTEMNTHFIPRFDIEHIEQEFLLQGPACAFVSRNRRFLGFSDIYKCDKKIKRAALIFVFSVHTLDADFCFQASEISPTLSPGGIIGLFQRPAHRSAIFLRIFSEALA